jgi:hypothetical protein
MGPQTRWIAFGNPFPAHVMASRAAAARRVGGRNPVICSGRQSPLGPIARKTIVREGPSPGAGCHAYARVSMFAPSHDLNRGWFVGCAVPTILMATIPNPMDTRAWPGQDPLRPRNGGHSPPYLTVSVGLACAGAHGQTSLPVPPGLGRCDRSSHSPRVHLSTRSTVKGPPTRFIALGNPYKFGHATRRLFFLVCPGTQGTVTVVLRACLHTVGNVSKSMGSRPLVPVSQSWALE